MPDLEAAVGALRTYHEGGHCGDGIHHLYATVLRGQRLSPTSAINVITTPSHWITDLNIRVDAATRKPLEVDLTWLLRRPFSFLPPVTYRDQLSPTALSGCCKIGPPYRRGPAMRPYGGQTTRRGVDSPSTGSIATSSAMSRRTAWTTSPR